MPLSKHFLRLESAELHELAPLFPPLMHTICLVYSNSQHYNSPARVIILLQVCKHLLIYYTKYYCRKFVIFWYPWPRNTSTRTQSFRLR